MGKLKRLLSGGPRRGSGGGNGPQEAFPIDQADVDAIDQLRAQGKDLARPLVLRHTLRLPTQEAADQVSGRLPNRGFEVQVQPDGVVVATRSNRVTPEELAQIRGHLTRLAGRLGGSYEGWALAE